MYKEEIIGNWIFENGQITTDSNCKVIGQMIEQELSEIGKSEDGWTTQYKAANGTIWELSYPQSHLHGGGPPKLVQVEST